MKAKFTPGPWIVSPDSVTTVIEVGPLKRSIAHADDLAIRCSNEEYDERDANARLIAAAPDLLAALQHIAALEGTESNEWDGVDRLIPEICDIARAAIAKAVQS